MATITVIAMGASAIIMLVTMVMAMMAMVVILSVW